VKLSRWERALRDKCGETVETVRGASFYSVRQQKPAQKYDTRFFNALERLIFWTVGWEKWGREGHSEGY